MVLEIGYSNKISQRLATHTYKVVIEAFKGSLRTAVDKFLIFRLACVCGPLRYESDMLLNISLPCRTSGLNSCSTFSSSTTFALTGNKNSETGNGLVTIKEHHGLNLYLNMFAVY